MGKENKPLPEVKKGQVWEDCDKRYETRPPYGDGRGKRFCRVMVEADMNVPNPGESKVTVDTWRESNPDTKGRSRIALRRFVPNSTGWKLREDMS